MYNILDVKLGIMTCRYLSKYFSENDKKSVAIKANSLSLCLNLLVVHQTYNIIIEILFIRYIK